MSEQILTSINGLGLVYLGVDPKTKTHSYLTKFPGSVLVYRRNPKEEKKHKQTIAAIEQIKAIRGDIPQVFAKYKQWTRLVDVSPKVYSKIDQKFEVEVNLDTLEFKIIGVKEDAE